MTAAFVLMVADAIPGVIRHTGKGVTHLATLEDAGRVVGLRLPQPSYYPSALQWPPSEIRAYLDRAAAAWCRTRTEGRIDLVVAVARTESPAAIDAVLPPAVVLQEADGLAGHPGGQVTRLRDPDGALWQQASWTASGRRVVIRSRGTLDDLMRIVSSLRE